MAEKQRRKKTCEFCLHYNPKLKRCIKKKEKVDASKRRICEKYSKDEVRFRQFETYKKSIAPIATWGFTDEYYKQYWEEYDKQLNRIKIATKRLKEEKERIKMDVVAVDEVSEVNKAIEEIEKEVVKEVKLPLIKRVR